MTRQAKKITIPTDGCIVSGGGVDRRAPSFFIIKNKVIVKYEENALTKKIQVKEERKGRKRRIEKGRLLVYGRVVANWLRHHSLSY